MLLWESIFLFLLVLTFWSFFFSTTNLLSLLFSSELLVIVMFTWVLLSAIFSNITVLFGLSYLLLVFGGLELALSIIILLL